MQQCIVKRFGTVLNMSDCLNSKRSELTAALRENRAALRRSRAEAARLKRRVERVWVLPRRVRHVVVLLLELSGYDTSPPSGYLKRFGERRGWPPKTDDELRDVARDVFLSMDPRAAAGLIDIECERNAAAYTRAHQYLEEFRLHQWASQANINNGVAVPSRFLVARLASLRAAAGRPPPGASSQPRVRKWAERFRRRWGGHFGALPASDVVPLPEMVAKATLSRSGQAHQIRVRSVIRSSPFL